MLEPHEITGLAKAVAGVIRDNVTKAKNELKAEIYGWIEERIKELPPAPKGERGEKGETGERGEKGDQGLRGEQGPQGDAGPTGKDGAEGIQGIDGKIGDRGEKGERGEQGIKGDSVIGPIGIQGITGKQGERGEKGLDGRDGKDGKDARDGRDGKDGAPGRDALEIEILPAIDPTKSYPRGTFAKHKGGLVRAIKNVEPGDVTAWDVIVDGHQPPTIERLDDLRTFVIRSMLTSGPSTKAVFSLPVTIYREIFRDGNEYAAGDAVTYGGSVWICVVDATKSKPGTSSDWKLMVKRGADGKDGKLPEPPQPKPPIIIGGNGQK